MKKIKKLTVVIVVLVMVLLSFVPSTFSWYPHNASSTGNKVNYTDDIPLSVKSAISTVSCTTYLADENGNTMSLTDYRKKTGEDYSPVNGYETASNDNVVATKVSVSPQNAIKYYKTTLINQGANDVFVDLNVKTMPNNADFYIGTTSPTVNEKAYASRAVRTKVTATTVRVYFKTHSSMSSYWSQSNYDKRLVNEKGTYQIDANGNLTEKEITSDNNKPGSSFQQDDDTGTNNDINISFTVEGREYQAKMLKCPDADTVNNDNTGLTSVFYYDLPTNTTSFFFFNHWYLRSSSNREWNRTLDITDLTAGKLYYLDGTTVDGKYKSYKARAIDTELVAVNSYYSYVRMSLGNNVFADIGLKKTSDAEDFIPEYYGSSIKYSSSNANKATVNIDGQIAPVATTTSGNTDTPITVTTTITGRYGDTKVLATSVSIPASISDVPIITNVKVPAMKDSTFGKVEIDWYALNKGSSAMTTGNIFYTL